LPARTYATETTSSGGKLRLNFVVPHDALMKDIEATQVNISSTDGDMGILAEHVPTIAQLKPGIVEIFTAADKPKKYFASGGFAIINPDSTLNINAIEAFPIEDLDLEETRRAADDATRRSTSTATEAEKLTAKIELEVYEAILANVTK
ncbi:F1 complex, delta/epsilon subunit of ATPase, partial [Phlyctochytrium arcticum]